MNKPPKRLLDKFVKRFIPESCVKIDENLLSYQFSPDGKPEASICSVI